MTVPANLDSVVAHMQVSFFVIIVVLTQDAALCRRAS